MATHQLSYKAILLASISFLIIAAPQANAGDICEAIKVDQEVEAAFATGQRSEYETSLDGTKFRYSIPGPPQGGSCYSETLGLAKDGGVPEISWLMCSYNGCGFGARLAITEWQGKGYVLSKSADQGTFERLNGWKHLAPKEQEILKFRNLTGELYMIELPKQGQARSVCEYGYQKPVYKEKSLVNSPLCNELAAEKVTSVFPEGSIPVNDRINYDLARLIEVDLNADGKLERLAPIGAYSGAGCGCDIERIALLDANNQPSEKTEGFAGQFIVFNQSLSCRERADIISLNGHYYLEKLTGNKMRRIKTREIYPLSGDNAFQQICSYINEAPLNWESVGGEK